MRIFRFPYCNCNRHPFICEPFDFPTATATAIHLYANRSATATAIHLYANRSATATAIHLYANLSATATATATRSCAKCTTQCGN